MYFFTECFCTTCNDDPLQCNTIDSGANCNYVTGDNTNATSTGGVPNPGCASYLGSDVWFSVTVPASGSIDLDSDIGGMFDVEWLYTVEPVRHLHLFPVMMTEDTNEIMPALTISGQTPGSTLYIRFWSYADGDNGSFSICAVENIPLPPSNQDCPNAIPICQNVYSTAVSYSGEGNILAAIDPFNSCLASGEFTDVWYTFYSSGKWKLKLHRNTE
ncbi:MAG: hypothetical protein IPP27_05430 [Bacteroidetes bacterium]|nr:hypothetical protein [Bacteroidota bacterium]